MPSAYVDLGDVQHADWVETLSFVTIGASALDSTAFESAELHYLKGNYRKAYSGFESYVNAYPKSIQTFCTYLGSSALQIDSSDQALLAFEVVNSFHGNTFSAEALKQTALLYQQKKMYDKLY